MNAEYKIIDNVCLIKTNKYKSINLYLNFAKEYDLKSRLALHLLSRFIGEYSNSYKTKVSMTRAKDMLYGASVNAFVRVKENLVLLNVKYSFINPKFLIDVSTEDFVEYLKEVLDNVYFSEELLQEFKKNYKDGVSRSLDKPNAYASNRVVQIVSKEDSNFASYDIDHIDEIDDISLDDIKTTYENLKKDYSIDTYIVGDYDETLVEYIRGLKSDKHFLLNNEQLVIKDLGTIVEEKDISQSVLNVVYDTPNNRLSEDFYAYTLGNILFGVVPTSLLFEEIREKLSLCYYVSVFDYKNEGLVNVFTSYDKKNTDKIVEEIDKQLKRLINKDYDFEKLESARALFIDSLRSTNDDTDSYIDFLYTHKLNGLNVSLDEYEEGLNKVTVDDISRVFKNYKHVLTYVLKGVKDEEDL